MKRGHYRNPRLDHSVQTGDPVVGEVSLDVGKVFWLTGMIAGTLAGFYWMTLDALAVFVFFTAVTLCLGHSLGMHRRLIHRSYECSRWLEYLFVHLGVLVGMAGPLGMLRTHDTRDWAQRQTRCHPYFSHDERWFKDAYWQLFCSIKLLAPPDIRVEPEIQRDPVYPWMEQYWMCQQIPWALFLYALGGLPWVCWGICARVTVSVIGHWFIGYFAHNVGDRSWHVEGAAVQGHNVRWASLITMGESWHNNHHAFPGSARLGVKQGEWDPGWWVLCGLVKLDLAKNPVLPGMLPQRNELMAVYR
ncbi:MAG: acyl-CoA desaturase [Pseudomonadota bacterium]